MFLSLPSQDCADSNTLSVADLHTEQNYVEDKAKCLTHQQKSLITTAVKLAPTNSISLLLMCFQDLPTNAELKNFIQHMICQER